MFLFSTSSSEPSRDGLIAVDDRLPPSRAGRAAAILALIVFGIVVFGTLLVDGLAPVPAPKPIGAEAKRDAQMRRSARFADGSLASLVEHDLRQRSRIRNTILPPWSRALYRWLRWVKEPVVCGPDGWLFMKSRLTAGLDNPMEQIEWSGAVAAALERRFASFGHRLVLIPIPRKGTIAADRLPSGIDARPELDRLFLEELDRRGVAVVDVVDALEEVGPEAYHMVGSHWTDGAQAAAAGAVVEQLGRRPTVDPEAIERAPMSLRQVDYDLLEMIGAGGKSSLPAEAARQRIVIDRVKRRISPNRHPTASGEVVLLGSSFSAVRKFPILLEKLLGVPVWNGAHGGWVPDSVSEAFLKHRGPPALVLQETPMHHLLDRAHLRFLVETSACRPPDRYLVFRAARDDELKLSTGETHSIRRRTHVLGIPPRRIAHTGDGVLSFRLRGSVSAPLKIIVAASARHRITYPWHPDTRELALPVLHSTSASKALWLVAEPAGAGPVDLRLDSVQLISEVAPDRAFELGEPVIESDGKGWRGTIAGPHGDRLGRDAVLVLRLGLGDQPFHQRLTIVIHPVAGKPLTRRFDGLGRGSLILTSLRPLEGHSVDRIEIRGSGPAPTHLLNRSVLQLGADPDELNPAER